MANDEYSLSTNRSEPRPVAILQGNIAEHGNGDWNGVAASPPPQSVDIKVYLHSLRRHWLMALGIGLLCAPIVGVGIFYLIGAQYTSSAILRISMQEKQLVDTNTAQPTDRDRFDIYKNTQEQLICSRFLLLAALRKPEVTKLSIISDLNRKKEDAVEWVDKRLSVSFPSKAEIMAVNMTHTDAQEATILVKAIVDSYMTDVVNLEQDQKRNRLSELERVCTEKELDIRNKRNTFKSIVENTGTSGETDALTVKAKLLLEELALFRNEFAKSQFEVRRIFGELAAQKALLQNSEDMEVPAAELDVLMKMDPQASSIAQELSLKTMEETYTQSRAKEGATTLHVTRYTEEKNLLQKQYDARVEDVRKKAQEKRRLAIALDVLKLETMLSTTQQQQESVVKDITRMQNEAVKIGTSSVEIEMLRSEIKQQEMSSGDLTREKDKVRVELRATPRITPLGEVELPMFPSNTLWRIFLSVAGSLFFFSFPAVIIALWDSQARRINTSDDISKGLQLPVIGSVPLIPSRVIRQLGTPSKKNQTWHMRLTESVDGIAARILRKADMEQSRVIMVSSATSGEGKTTLATQLAMSLARTGRGTVLVDFDLRRPSFDEVFGLSLEPGISEALRQESSISELVHPTGTENLSVVTAGRWNRQALASLSNGSAAALFKQLRERFEFVVIDTSPILPVADARFISQHVDSVVLSVFRDVSEAPKIRAACDILAAFGVQSVEAVVTGPNTNSYGELVEYESTVSA